ncbi:MAG: ATP-binding protein [Bdellovibrionota bacterium]
MKLNRISLKLSLVCLSFTLPIAVMLVLMVKAKQKDIDFGDWEKKGNLVQRPLEGILKQVSLHRWFSSERISGKANATEIAKTESEGTDSIEKLKAAMAAVGEDLQFTPEGLGKRNRSDFTVENLAKRWDVLKALDAKTSIEDSEQLHKEMIAQIKAMITHAGDTSNLILDPDLDSYYLMDVSLLALPQMQDRLQEIALFFEQMSLIPKLSEDQKIQAMVYASFLKESDNDRINGSSQTSLSEDQNFYGVSPSLQTNLASAMVRSDATVKPVIAELKNLAHSATTAQYDFASARKVLLSAIDSSYSFHAIAFDELDALIDTRLGFFHADVKRAILWTCLSLAISIVLASFIAFNLIRRIRLFQRTTTSIAGGDLKARTGFTSGDEINELGQSFDAMNDQIEKLNLEIASKNDELKGINTNLESIVAERTATIKLILNNVKFGFLLVKPDLTIGDGYSRACSDLLSENLEPGMPFLKAVGLEGSRNAPMYNEFLNQAFEDFLPEAMTLQQLPSRVQIGEKILSLVASPVRGPDKSVQDILFTIVDSTNLERAEKESHKHKTLVRLLKEIESFEDFLDDTRKRLASTRDFVKLGDQGKARAELHTIKGNSSAYDLVDIAKLVHHIEDAVTIEVADIDRIEATFIGFLDDNVDILSLSWNGDGEASYEVSHGEVHSLVGRVQDSLGSDHLAMRELSTWLSTLRYKTLRSLVGALPDYGERLASRLGKSVKIRLINGDMRVNPEIMRPITQSLVHLVRNSIDHGIEPMHMRGDKNEEGFVTIECKEDEKYWIIAITDDGRGIDTKDIAEHAISKGLITREAAFGLSDEEKLKLIFLSGVSTAETVSEISGRGVGMNAMESSVKEAGGLIQINSTVGQGTSILIKIPRENIDVVTINSKVA